MTEPKNDGRPDPRAERLAAALRENLKRRKAQARGRRDVATATGEEQGSNDDEAPRSGGT